MLNSKWRMELSTSPASPGLSKAKAASAWLEEVVVSYKEGNIRGFESAQAKRRPNSGPLCTALRCTGQLDHQIIQLVFRAVAPKNPSAHAPKWPGLSLLGSFQLAGEGGDHGLQ